MKIFLWIVGVIAGVFIILLIGLNIYFTNERLQGMIVPQLQEAMGREIVVEDMSVTFFRTFPNFGLKAGNIRIPDDRDGTLASIERMILSVNLIPYFRNEIHVSRLDLIRPELIYIIYEDGTTNIDELLAFMEAEEPDEPADEPMDIELRHMFIDNGFITYDDRSTGMRVHLNDIESQTSLRFAGRLETSMLVNVKDVSVYSQDDRLISGLTLSLEQSSGIDMENEQMTIETGRLDIEGLALNMTGELSGWGNDSLFVNLLIESESDDFASLLELVPETYHRQIEGVEASGHLSIQGTINGHFGEDLIPGFQFLVTIEDGYLHYPDMAEPVERITLSVEAHNEFIDIRRFGAFAGENHFSAFGEIRAPLSEDARFAVNMEAVVDLADIRNFYPVEEEGLELAGKMNLSLITEGLIRDYEASTFDAELYVENGYVRYADVEEPVEDIQIDLIVNQSAAEIRRFSARAAGNVMDIRGTIMEPLNRDATSFDLFANLDLDLGTVHRFYEMDEDTLILRGHLVASGTARGQAADPENADMDFNVTLADGYIHHHSLGRPIEELTFDSNVNSTYLEISSASLKTGSNRLRLSGRINDYLGDSPVLDIQTEADLHLHEAADYFDLAEFQLTELNGNLNGELAIRGPLRYPEDIVLAGNVYAREVMIAGTELPLPVRDLNAVLNISEEQAELQDFSMFMGESDFRLDATLSNYMALTAEIGQTEPAVLSGSWHSRKLNVDELYQYDPEAPDEPFPIELPNMVTQLTASADTVIFMGVTATNLSGRTESDTRQISMPEGSVELFGGSFSGSFVWDIPDPERTELTFQGRLDNLRAESFFEEFNLSGRLRFHQFVSGGFSSDIEFFTELDVFLDPVLPTTLATGNFGMQEAGIRNHPIQQSITQLFGVDEFEDLTIDDWRADFNIDDEILSLDNLNITSQDIGLTLSGSHNLENDTLDFSAQITLPGRYLNQLSRIIPEQGLQALSDDKDHTVIPFHIGGTYDNPVPSLDEGRIEDILTEFLRSRVEEEGRDAARGILRRMFDN